MSTTSSHTGVAPKVEAAITSKLMSWYTQHQRELPWRGHPDPYGVWVSEIMLQQTRVTTVRPYFERWMRHFPTPEALASADPASVMSCWEGLGYYSRARNLQRAAQLVVQDHGGKLPRSIAALKSLPGVGRYSAGAIASIAHGVRCAAVDGNVVRVLSRLFRIGGDPKKAATLERLWSVAEQLLPREAGRAGDFNQALMELGASHCAPRAAQCESCPLVRHCKSYKSNSVEQYPEVTKRPPPVEVHRVALLLRRGERILVQRVAADAKHWQGMWIFPQYDMNSSGPDACTEKAREAIQELDLNVASLEFRAAFRHHVTRYKITLGVVEGRVLGLTPHTHFECQWLKPEALHTIAMPAPHRRIAEQFASRSDSVENA